MDLEQVLPAGVQVTSIQPSVAADGDVTIHLRVSGPRELEVNLMRNLEHSKRFLQPHLVNETAQVQENGRVVAASQTGVPGAVQFDILSGYNPLPVIKPATEAGSAVKQVRAGARAGGVAGTAAKAKRIPNTGASGAMPARPEKPLPPKNQVTQPVRPPVSGGGR
jgi:type IV pilus assembly protein PilN